MTQDNSMKFKNYLTNITETQLSVKEMLSGTVDRIAVLRSKIIDQTPFELKNGEFVILKNEPAILKALTTDLPGFGTRTPKYVFHDENNNEVRLTALVKTEEFGGRSGGKAGLQPADWEKIIAVAHNMIKFNVSEMEAVKMAKIKTWTEMHTAQMPVGFKIVESVNLPNTKMLHYGTAKNKLTPEWEQYFLNSTGKKAFASTKTSKTDMYLTNMNISLKQKGGSQLMSGGKGETLATLEYAFENTANEIKTKHFEQVFKTLNDNVAKHFNKLENVNITAIKKDIKNGKKSELITVVEHQLNKNKEMKDAILELTKTPLFKTALVHEAMTGKHKFADELPKATHLMVFNPRGFSSLTEITNAFSSEIAKKTKFDISMKSASGSSWVAMKGLVKETVETDFLQESLVETIEEYEMNESFASFASVGTFVINGFKAITQFVKTWINKIFSKLMSKLSTLLTLTGYKLNFETPTTTF